MGTDPTGVTRRRAHEEDGLEGKRGGQDASQTRRGKEGRGEKGRGEEEEEQATSETETEKKKKKSLKTQSLQRRQGRLTRNKRPIHL